ncbi:MAG TPA: NYN domain-containing protein [Candidatus Polarisedimenticolia bacterium]|jgi:predicted RNA-binding protein with PIN domain|nr:NYN domain-containing protein [Candidatus Polarisedimenticolia bacterium]
MAPRRIWIMDGHNMIFAIPPLQRLQVSDRREEARGALADSLERFALARGEKVLIVFDGRELPPSSFAIRKPLLEIIYARGGEGAADVRILHEARLLLERGSPVTVVTDDVSTLARELPRGALHMGVRAFWLKHIQIEPGEEGKRVEGDFSDVEREMIRTAMTEPIPGPRRLVPVHQAGVPPGQLARAPEETNPERIRRKREKGRLRQERRLKRRAKPGPRR